MSLPDASADLQVTVTACTVVPYDLPLKAPVPTPYGSIRRRHGWLLLLKGDDGAFGLGDAAAWPGFGSGHDAVAAAIDAVAGELEGETLALGRPLHDLTPAVEVRHAAELALLDLLGQRVDRSVGALLHGEVAATVSLHELHPSPTARCIKVKVGAEPLDADLEHIASLVARHPNARLRLDAGGRLDFDGARCMLDALAPHAIDFVEQPLAVDDPALVALRDHARALGIRLALDESIRGPETLRALLAEGAADVAVLKPMYLGGPVATAALAGRVREAGWEVVITHALESAVGRAGAIHLAAGFPGAHGLADPHLRDVARLPRPRDGRRVVPTAAGLGVTLAPSSRAPGPSRIPAPLVAASRARPDHVALVTPEASLTHAELAHLAGFGRAALHAAGVARGDVVALPVAGDLTSAVAIHAVLSSGATLAPLPAEPGPERDRLVSAIAPDHLFEPHHLGATETCPVPPAAPWCLDEACVVIATSGSTGSPKVIPITAHQLVFSAFGSATRLGLSVDDRWLGCLPLHHVGGLSVLLRSILYGTTAVLHPRFDVEAVAAALDDVTLVSLVPAMLQRLLDHRPPPWPRLRAILIGGAALTGDLRERARGLPIAASWGMTEAASQVATTFPGDLAPGAPPLPFAQVEELHGRLHVQGPLVGGSLASSDRGHVDRTGRVHVAGRVDDILISGGKKIDPAGVERALRALPEVADAAVVAVPSVRWGQRLVAALVAHEAPVGDADLRQTLGLAIPRWEIPDRFTWLERLPRSPLGKLRRAELREQLEEHHDEHLAERGADTDEGHHDDRRQ